MDDGPPPVEEDFSSLPLGERLAHKNWKARVHGYEALIKAFAASGSDSDPVFKQYINNPEILKKIVVDSNVVAQEKGVEAVLTFINMAGETCARTREVVMPAVADKCFGSTRMGTKQKAWAVAVSYVEIENGGDGVIRDVLPGLSAKQPKVVAGSVTALKEIVKAFGPKVVPPQQILKILPKIFGHSDKSVRAEGTLLVQSLYTWLGPALQSFLSELKPVQVKELTEGFEALDKEGKGQGTATQERYTRAQAREREEAELNGNAGEVEEAEEEAMPDPRSLAEEVDIIPKIPADFHTQILSTKWKERKETLDAVFEVANTTPRIKESDGISELVRALAKRMTDANVMCVMTAANIIGLLAAGMGEPFGKYRSVLLPSMLERFKERKQNVVDAIGDGLDKVFLTTTLSDMMEDLLTSLKSKNPQVKDATLKFFNRCLSNTRIPPAKGDIKPIAESLIILLGDSFEPIRASAQEGLGILMKIIGERALNPFLEPVDDIKKAKVKEAFEKATVKCKAGGSAPPKPPAAAPPPPTKPPARLVKAAPSTTPLAEQPPNSQPSKPPPAAAPKKLPPAVAAAAAKASKAGPATVATVTDNNFKYKFTPEDAEALSADLIPAQLAADLGDSAWKVRLAALDEFQAWLDGAIDTAECEVVIRFLGKKPGWNEKNFQVSAKVFGVFSTLAERSPTFSKACVALATPHMTEKLGDMKLKKPAGDTLLVFAEKTSLAFVLGLAYDPMGKQKAPKVLADSIVWINVAITDFGIAGLPLRALIDFLKAALKNSNAGVRTSATTTLVTLRLFAGSGIKDFLEDLNPQLLTTIQSEFDKVDGQPAPVPTKVSADLANAPVAQSGKGKSAGADPMDELYPRVDLEKLVATTNILSEAKSDAWKSRKEALELLQSILDVGANKRLKPNIGDIAPMLKARLADTNKVVQGLALDISAKIATGMNKPFEKYSRILVLPVAQVMADQKTNIRASAVTTLTAIATACEGLDSLAHFLGTALESPNPLMRTTLLGWISTWCKENPPASSVDLSTWSAPLVSCLEDRSADVRKGAQAILPVLVSNVGFDAIMDKTNALKPASRATVIPLLQAAKAAASPVSAPSTGPSRAAAPANAPPAETRDTAPPTEAAAPPPKRKGLLSRKFEAPASRPASPGGERPASVAGLRGPAKLGLKRPGTPVGKAPISASDGNSSMASTPFIGTNLDVKKNRLARDAGRWIIESGPSRKDLSETLHHQMEPHTSKELIALLFSHDHNAINDHIAGLTMISDCYKSTASGEEAYGCSVDDMKATLIANSDLPLKYVSTKIHEPQPNLIIKCLEAAEAVLLLLSGAAYQLSESEAAAFVPTIIYKLGDARETVRARVSGIIQNLPKVFASSRLFSLLLEHGLRSKVAKTRQHALDELAHIIRRTGMAACEPQKAFPLIASMIADKDAQVRKSALSVIGEAYVLDGEKVWSYLGRLSSKDKTQVEEKLKRLPGPVKASSVASKLEPAVPAQVARLTSGLGRPGSPSGMPKTGGIPRPGSPATPGRSIRPGSPTVSPLARAGSPALSNRPASPVRRTQTIGAGPSSPRPRSLPVSRLAVPRGRPAISAPAPDDFSQQERPPSPGLPTKQLNGHSPLRATLLDSHGMDDRNGQDEISITISSILSGDPSRSVDALKKIQKILEVSPDSDGPSPQFQNLADHTEGLIETITLQMAHVFDRPENVKDPNNYRLAKHLIQTLNAFCDHAALAETLPVDILTSLLEELTVRLLQTDESGDSKVKDLSRFINMIILRLFATGRRINVFRALFNLLLQITKPFSVKGTAADSREAKVAELVLKCMWKLARGIPTDLEKGILDPVELFPALEAFLQSIPPNEWRARAASKIPCGDMPLRTIKVVIQHVVAGFADEVYDQLSAAFDDPSATIVYPYVYRILNSTTAPANGHGHSKTSASPVASASPSATARPTSTDLSPTSPPRPVSTSTIASVFMPNRPRSDSGVSRSASSANGHSPSATSAVEPDPDAKLIEIIGHISSELSGALHKEGITELHHFLKAYPLKRSKVDKMLDATGPQFRKYLARALASRAAEDEERGVAVANTLSRLESSQNDSEPTSPVPKTPTSMSPRRASGIIEGGGDDRALSRLHGIFQYQGRSSVYMDSRRDSRRASVTSSTSASSPGPPDALMSKLETMKNGMVD